MRKAWWLGVLALGLAGCGGATASTTNGNTTTQWTINTFGGTFQTTDQAITISIPANAVSTTTTVTGTPLSNPPTGPTGFGYIQLTGYDFSTTTFNNPVIITIPFAAQHLTPGQAATVVFYTQTPGSNSWVAQSTSVDVSTSVATVHLTNLNTGALFYNLSAH